MHYVALYQTRFKGLPQPLSFTSHAFVCDIEAEDPEAAFRALQAECMPEGLAWRIHTNPQVQHTSMSVGDILISEAGDALMVDLIGFRPLCLETAGAAAAFALHLKARGLEGTQGWDELVRWHGTTLVAALAEQLLQGNERGLKLAP